MLETRELILSSKRIEPQFDPSLPGDVESRGTRPHVLMCPYGCLLVSLRCTAGCFVGMLKVCCFSLRSKASMLEFGEFANVAKSQRVDISILLHHDFAHQLWSHIKQRLCLCLSEVVFIFERVSASLISIEISDRRQLGEEWEACRKPGKALAKEGLT